MCNAARAPTNPLSPPARPPRPAPATTGQAVRRPTRGCQLSKLREVLLPRVATSARGKALAERTRAQVVAALAAAIFPSPLGPTLYTIEHCERLLAVVLNAPAAKWSAVFMGAVRACVDVLRLDAAAPSDVDLFLVYTPPAALRASSAMLVERVGGARDYRACTIDAVLASPKPRLIAAQLHRDSARVLACA